MKKILIVLLVTTVSCTSQESGKTKGKSTSHAQQHTAVTVPLNNGDKWKADDATKQNVAVIAQIVNDNNYRAADKRKQLSAALQSQIDTLIKQCRMKGPEHDALHVWLERVLKDMKELKKEDDEYKEVYAALKTDIEAFYATFE
jgi:hypothetical protein